MGNVHLVEGREATYWKMSVLSRGGYLWEYVCFVEGGEVHRVVGLRVLDQLS